MQQTAVEVLKDYEQAIALDRGGDVLSVRGVPGPEAAQEVRAALLQLVRYAADQGVSAADVRALLDEAKHKLSRRARRPKGRG
jgi:hypothetical protein